AFTVVPRELECQDSLGEKRSLHPLWNRRFSTKFNGVSYVTQRAAEALYSLEGKTQVAALVSHYMGNAKILREAVARSGLAVYGGINAPYIWVRGPRSATSWEVFDRILNEANIVITPGSGFGAAGEGYFRISAFNSRTKAEEAAGRLASLKW
ncbi:MAG: aminotransferase class I/II-fold pyridoxal phosphate-dependent enzyme, partial [Terrimicrobiaceae bacterium]